MNHVQEWLGTEIEGYRFFMANRYYDTAKYQKAMIMGEAHLTEEEFNQLVKGGEK